MKLKVILFLFAVAASDAVAQGQSPPILDVAFSMSTLGFGAQAARPLTLRSDVRGGFSDKGDDLDGGVLSGIVH